VPYTYALAAASNRLVSRSGPSARSYGYDAAGNLTANGASLRFTYDARGRLVQTKVGSSTIAHTINALGQRVRSTGFASFFLYDEAGDLLGEYNPNAQPLHETVWLDDLPVALLSGNAPSPTIAYIYADHLNSPRMLTDTANTIVWRWDNADAFGLGDPLLPASPSPFTFPFTYNARLPGQYYDRETALHYNYFRYYDPATGRYITSDPIGLKGGLNTYTYVGNNPTKFIDPLGLDVYVCGRPADLPFPLGLLNHEWLLTDIAEAGMGAEGGGVPAQNGNSDYPGTPVEVVDHKDESTQDNAHCDKVENVDESCVNKLIRIGRPLGSFGPTNNCQTFVMDVIIECSANK